MGVYIPLRVRLTPASIPLVVAYIQTYLKDNPIPSIDTFADLIAEFLSDHPELVAVASVNGKTGAVILTGADIMLNGDSALTLETEITNLNSMISNLSRQVAEAVATVENAQEDIDDLGSQIGELEQTLTTLENSITLINNTIDADEDLISANTTKNAQQDTRLTAIENTLDDVEEDIDNLQTLTELHTQQIHALTQISIDPQELEQRFTDINQRITDDYNYFDERIDDLSLELNDPQTGIKKQLSDDEENITTLTNFMNSISSFQNLYVEFGTIDITGLEDEPGIKSFTFNHAYSSTPFVCVSISGATNRLISVHLNNMSSTGGTVVCKRILDSGGNSGWGGSATVYYMAIGT